MDVNHITAFSTTYSIAYYAYAYEHMVELCHDIVRWGKCGC